MTSLIFSITLCWLVNYIKWQRVYPIGYYNRAVNKTSCQIFPSSNVTILDFKINGSVLFVEHRQDWLMISSGKKIFEREFETKSWLTK